MIQTAPYIKFRGDGIEYQFSTHGVQDEDGIYSCYIPVFDIYFSAPNTDKIQVIADKLMNSFFNYHLSHKGYSKFITKILAIGFVANNRNQRTALLRGSMKMKKATLHAYDISIPSDFKTLNYSKISSGQMQMEAMA